MSEIKLFVDSSKGNFFYMFKKVIQIYYRKFFTLFLVSVILELIFFGIFQLASLEIGFVYNLRVNREVLSVEFTFANEFAQSFFFILLIVAIILFIIRMTIISNAVWMTAENGKANIIDIFEKTFSKLREILLFTLLAFVILVFPILAIILGLLLQVRLYYFSWSLILLAFFTPIFFGSKISLFIAGMSRDNLHVGAAIQKSWLLSSRGNYFKITFSFFVYAILGVIGPWFLTIYIMQRFPMVWIAVILAVGRALLYPLLDGGLMLNYLHLDFLAIDQAVFSKEIREQKRKSQDFIKSNSNKLN